MMMPISPLAGFFTIPAKTYEHFTLTYSAAKTLSTIVLAICAGVILAALYNFYIRHVPGGVVRLLLSRDALSPETALTAEELGLLDKPFSLWELLRGSALRHVVCAVNEEPSAEESVPASDDAEGAVPTEENESAEEETTAQTRFYIPEEQKYRAQGRFEQKGNGVKGLVITCALTIVLGIVLIKLIPVVLAIADNMM